METEPSSTVSKYIGNIIIGVLAGVAQQGVVSFIGDQHGAETVGNLIKGGGAGGTTGIVITMLRQQS